MEKRNTAKKRNLSDLEIESEPISSIWQTEKWHRRKS
uniref:Uncharacterized protein n=1 Tax=Anguilla anguilla TaxID=7936 RepID=A0A0E9WD00_ANGAN